MIASSRFLVVEDELLIAETISDFLKGEGCKEIAFAASVEEALKHIEFNQVDFVLTDIALGNGKTGVDLGGLLYTKYRIPFIYITSHADKTTIDKAKHTRPNAYIVKPFKKEDLFVAIELGMYNSIHAFQGPPEDEELVVKEGRALVRLSRSHITWLESDGNYTMIYLKDGKRHVIRQALSDMQGQLPAASFIRIHKSYIVNKLHITELSAGSLKVHSMELPIGRAYQQNITDIFR